MDTILTRDVISCGSVDSLQDIWSTMNARALQRIPIVDRRGKPIGIAYARDTLQNLLGEAENEEALLRDYVMGVGYR